MPSFVCVFDVNETLLDLGALDRPFAEAFGDVGVRREWFQQMLQSAFVSTITRNYYTFGALGAAALEMVTQRHGVTLTDEQQDAILGGMRRLPAHPDVPAGLQRLLDAGVRLATLTNSTAEVGEQQIENAGLRPFFDVLLSADTVRRLKPAPEPYHMAAERLGVPVGQIVLVAAHAWDVAGAMSAGCEAAFVARPGQVLNPLAPRPRFVGTDIVDIAVQVLAAG